MRVDIRYLDTFLTVCETGGIAKASAQLHLTQPAVSYRIKMLEQQLNTKLFNHRGKRIVLTDTGKRLQSLSVRYLEELSTIHTDLIHPTPELRQTMRIGSVSGFGRYILFPVLCEEEFSGYRLHLTYPTAIEIFDEIEQGTYDLGFVYHKKTSNLLQFHKTYEEELVLISGKGFSKNLPNLNKIENYSALPFITYDESDYVFGKWFDSMFGRQPNHIPSLHHFQELEEVIVMISQMEGITIIPDYVINSKKFKERITILRPLKKKCLNMVYAVTSTGKTDSAITKKLLKILKAPR